MLETAVELLELADVRASDQPQHKLAMQQLYLPIADGGFGLRRTIDTCHAAFLSAHISVIRDQPSKWADISEQYADSYSVLMQVITECVDNVRNKILPSSLDDSEEDITFRDKQRAKMERLLIPWPPDEADDSDAIIGFPSLLGFYGKGSSNDTPDTSHLQTSLTRLATSARIRAFRHSSSPLINELSVELREGYNAHMRSLLNPHCGRWLSVAPRAARFTIRNAYYTSVIRTRLYLQGQAGVLVHCGCQSFRAESGKYTADPLHALSCSLQRRRAITDRHDMVIEALATGIREAGTRVVVEQTGYDEDSSRRPDLFGVIDKIPTFIDVGIIQPSAMTYRNLKPLEAVRRYEKVKVKKYTPTAYKNFAGIMPYIVESNGGHGENAQYVLNDISNMVHNQSLAFAPSEVMRDMMDAIAVAIQNGNALTIRQSFENTTMLNFKRKRVMSAAQARRVGQTTLSELRFTDADDEADEDWTVEDAETQ